MIIGLLVFINKMYQVLEQLGSSWKEVAKKKSNLNKSSLHNKPDVIPAKVAHISTR